jgi:Tfp pilus assembly protein PilV
MDKKALTLIEVLVSAIILALVTTGLVGIFIAGRRQILHSRSRMTTGELGKLFLEPLQMQVRQGETSPSANDGWDQNSNLLRIPAAQENISWTGATENLNSIDFTPNYTVSRVRDSLGNDTGLRRVRVTINWTEPAP